MAEEQAMARRSSEAYSQQMAKQRAPLLAEAERKLRAGDYDGAELPLRYVEDSMNAALDLAKVYKRLTAEAVEMQTLTPEGLRELSRRAVHWTGCCFPSPHTQDEAESQQAWWNEVEAEFTALVGFNPIR